MKFLGVLFLGFLLLAGVVWAVRERQPSRILGVQTEQARLPFDLLGIRIEDDSWIAEGISFASPGQRFPIFNERSLVQIWKDDQNGIWTVEQSGSTRLIHRLDASFAPVELRGVSSRKIRIVDIEPRSQNMLTLEEQDSGGKLYFFEAGQKQTFQLNGSFQNGLIVRSSQVFLWSSTDPKVRPVFVKIEDGGVGPETPHLGLGEILFASRDQKHSGEIVVADRVEEQGSPWLRWSTLTGKDALLERSRLRDPFGTLEIREAVQISENEWWFLRGDGNGYRELWSVQFESGKQRRLLTTVQTITGLPQGVGVMMIRMLGEKGDEPWVQTLRASDREPQTLFRSENDDMIMALSQ